jgi:uncharacterized membrane protein YvbJ
MNIPDAMKCCPRCSSTRESANQPCQYCGIINHARHADSDRSEKDSHAYAERLSRNQFSLKFLFAVQAVVAFICLVLVWHGFDALRIVFAFLMETALIFKWFYDADRYIRL